VATTPHTFALSEDITSSRVILCEGTGDKSFFENLIAVRGLPDFYVTCPVFDIHPGGRGGFEQRLRSLRLQPHFEHVQGVIVVSDNDADPNSSFQAVRKSIHDAEYPAPNRPYVVIPGPPATAIMMIPGQGKNGQLETLCLEAIRDTWPIHFQCAEAYGACAGIETWRQGKQERAKLRALISHICEQDPNSSLMHLWSGGRELVIPLDHASFDDAARFLQEFDQKIQNAR